MKKKRRYLTATMPDGYVKTIGPTTDSFTHYWRIVAELEIGKSEVFWGHTRSQAEARKKRAATQDAARTRGWKSFTFEIAELVEAPAPGTTSPTSAQRRCRSIRSMRPPTTRPDKVQETAAAAEADKDDEPATWSVQPRHAPDKYG